MTAGPTYLLVEPVGERLEIDVGRIYVAVELLPRVRAYLAGRYGHGLDTLLATGLGDVDRVFQKDDRVIVREGNAPAPERTGGSGDLLGVSSVGKGVRVP